VIVVHGRQEPDRIGGRDVDPQPYSRQWALSIVREWPDITQGETLAEWPHLFREALRYAKNMN
jgi:hypothetical protein